MRKSITVFLLIGILFVMALRPMESVVANTNAAATPTPTLESDSVVLADLPQGFEFWCLPAGTVYPKNPADVQKGKDAVTALYEENSFTLNGPFSACFVQVPNESQYADAVVAIFDNSNSAAWYERQFFENKDGLVALLKHSYFVDPPYWMVNYRLEILADDGNVLFSAPLLYQREWQATRCWNGNMPNPLTLRCPLQQDLHPWDAGYGKPLPTILPKE